MNTEPLSYLFVPATRTDRIAKAQASGAGAVIVDLEDAVNFVDKAHARQALLSYDKTATHTYWLRINAMGEAYDADIALIAQLNHVAGVVLPKTENAEMVQALFHTVSLPVIVAIESIRGWQHLPEIAAVSGVFALTYGCLDLGAELGLTAGSVGANVVLDRLRVDLVMQSALHGLNAPIESIYADFQDTEGLTRYVQRWREMGFGGQLCIHPKQVDVVNKAAMPTEQERAFAQAVLDKFHETGAFAFSVNGKMVDLPVIEWAKATLS